jgi:hypothetical protein
VNRFLLRDPGYAMNGCGVTFCCQSRAFFAMKPFQPVESIIDSIRKVRRGELRHPAADMAIIDDHDRLASLQTHVRRAEACDARTNNAHIRSNVFFQT